MKYRRRWTKDSSWLIHSRITFADFHIFPTTYVRTHPWPFYSAEEKPGNGLARLRNYLATDTWKFSCQCFHECCIYKNPFQQKVVYWSDFSLCYCYYVHAYMADAMVLLRFTFALWSCRFCPSRYFFSGSFFRACYESLLASQDAFLLIYIYIYSKGWSQSIRILNVRLFMLPVIFPKFAACALTWLAADIVFFVYVHVLYSICFPYRAVQSYKGGPNRSIVRSTISCCLVCLFSKRCRFSTTAGTGWNDYIANPLDNQITPQKLKCQ